MSRPDLDLMAPAEVVGLLLDAEQRVVPAVRQVAPEVAAAAELVAERMRAGGRLVLVGAGTSGRLAVLQAAELPGTFGLPAGTVVGLTAGAAPGGLAGTDADEDDADAGRAAVAALGAGPADVVVAVAASGRTPYTLAAAGAAGAAGAAVVAVTTAGLPGPGLRGSQARSSPPALPSPLAELATVAVEVPIGAEVLRGSTRLTAGSAQKVVLDAITTAAMARLGRVHGDLMLDVVPANEKLRERAAGLVAEIAGCAPGMARAALAACDWSARAAVLHLVAGLPPDAAARQAAAHPTLRAALAAAAQPAGPGGGAAR